MSAHKPLVSAVLPAYNAAAFIERTLQSVCTQSWSELEILVVDDGSTDNTAQIVGRLAANDPRIRLLRQENQGVSAARNLGIRQARGEYVALLDADDIWMPEKIARQVQLFERSPSQVGLVYTQSVRIFEDGRPPVYASGGEAEGAVFFRLLQGNFLQNASTPMIRRSCFDRVGVFSLEYRKQQAQGCEDWDMYLRIAEHYEFRVVRAYLTGYRQSADSMSTNWRTMLRSYRLLLDGVRSRHANIPGYLFRWSLSGYCVYLANLASRGGDRPASLRLLGRAIVADPLVLSYRRVLKLVGRNLAGGRRRHRGDGSPAVAEDFTTGTDAVPGGRRPVSGLLWGLVQKWRRRRLERLEAALGGLGKTASGNDRVVETARGE